MGNKIKDEEKERIKLIEEKSSNILYRTVEKLPLNNEGFGVVWKNLHVSAKIIKQYIFKSSEYHYKKIIHGVNGCIKPSSLVAIMGPSGSGKSTFMSTLAYRHSAEYKVDGDIRVNGKKVEIEHMKQISGFVYQDDLFIPSLTVLEHLHFAARVKLDRRITSTKRQQIVEELLENVGLSYCGNNFIGTSNFGKREVNLSGGEKKRLSVAMELLTDPCLLFCDEPTSGLDSFSAYKLISLLGDMVPKKNKTILCSIHQPNEQIFSLFHQVILLFDGKIAFSGTPKNAIEFFKKMGYEYSNNENPAEYLIRNLTISSNQETKIVGTSNICEQFEKSEFAQNLFQYNEEITELCDGEFLNIPKINRCPWHHLLLIMTYRNIVSIIRDPAAQVIGMVYKMFLAFNIGICLMGTNTLTQEGIQSLKGAVFLMVSENFFSPTYAAMEQIPKRLPYFLREYSNNINSPSIFYIAHLLSVTPGLILDASVFTAILYWLAGLRNELGIFLWTVVINVLVLNVSNAFGFVLSVATNSYSAAQLVVLPLDVICLILSGLFIGLRTAPVFLLWVRYVSWMTLSCEALLILQLLDVNRIACSTKPNQPCVHTGEEVLSQLAFSSNNFSHNVLLMVVIYIIFHILGYCIFALKLFNKFKLN